MPSPRRRRQSGHTAPERPVPPDLARELADHAEAFLAWRRRLLAATSSLPSLPAPLLTASRLAAEHDYAVALSVRRFQAGQATVADVVGAVAAAKALFERPMPNFVNGFQHTGVGASSLEDE